MLLRFMALVTAVVHMVSAQGNSVLHQGESGDNQSVIVTARTRAFLSCESGDIVVKVNFTQPFRGLMYAHRSRSSPCRIHGTGASYYELRIPLKGCGTWQESPRVFVNNITIRFHPALELEEDETKTVVCRYPPPLTPPPGSIQVIERPTLTPSTIPTRVGTAKLSEVEILIIICLLLFLSLLTLGIGIAYFCLKRRNIHIIRKTTLSASAPPSQITRLSSSNLHPASSLLSSVLGHTVRIPRAVPYSVPAGRTSVMSSPDHPYEDYPASSSTTETTSGEMSETSVSSSSLAEDQIDSSKNLLYRKGGPRSILSIPKAILRKTGPKRWRNEPSVHQYYSKSGSAMSTFKGPEMEDQTVTTVLEPEGQPDDDNYWSVKNGSTSVEKRTAVERNDIQRKASSSSKPSVPVYAQVDKNKKTLAKSQETSTEKQNLTISEQQATKRSSRLPAFPGTAVRQKRIITEIPEESNTSEEITKNTTVTTSVRREVTETRILTPTADGAGKVANDPETKKAEILKSSKATLAQLDSALEVKDASSSTAAVEQKLVSKRPPKSILIRDVADIYLTTTVETESREMKTRVTRDIVEEHARTNKESTDDKPKTDLSKPKEPSKPKPSSPSTDSWNVVIRQKKPPPVDLAAGTDLDASAESNADTDGQEPEKKPRFDVKIRTIPPKELKPKKLEEVVPIPPLEMPQTVNMLKEAMMPKNTEKVSTTKPPDVKEDSRKESVKETPESREKALPPRTVRWVDETKDPSRDEGSTVSSSDSFQSSESLRERSSSEVLEVAPTLRSQRRNSDHPMLERSTSEIVTSPEEHSRWVGGVVPVLETLSPEFLANIPIVIQGGFFNRQKSPIPEEKTDIP